MTIKINKNGIVGKMSCGKDTSLQPNLLPKKIPAHNKVHKKATRMKMKPIVMTEITKNTGRIFVAPIRFIKTLFLNSKMV